VVPDGRGQPLPLVANGADQRQPWFGNGPLADRTRHVIAGCGATGMEGMGPFRLGGKSRPGALTITASPAATFRATPPVEEAAQAPVNSVLSKAPGPIHGKGLVVCPAPKTSPNPESLENAIAQRTSDQRLSTCSKQAGVLVAGSCTGRSAHSHGHKASPPLPRAGSVGVGGRQAWG